MIPRSPIDRVKFAGWNPGAKPPRLAGRNKIVTHPKILQVYSAEDLGREHGGLFARLESALFVRF